MTLEEFSSRDRRVVTVVSTTYEYRDVVEQGQNTLRIGDEVLLSQPSRGQNKLMRPPFGFAYATITSAWSLSS